MWTSDTNGPFLLSYLTAGQEIESEAGTVIGAQMARACSRFFWRGWGGRLCVVQVGGGGGGGAAAVCNVAFNSLS